MFSSKGVKLPCVFDLETGEVFEGKTAFDIAQMQGRKFHASYEGNEQKKSSFRHDTIGLIPKHKHMPEETVEEAVETPAPEVE